MAVETVKKVWAQDASDADNEGRRTRTLGYLVVTDDPDDGPDVAREASGVPQRGDQIPGTSLYVQSVRATARREHPCWYDVVVTATNRQWVFYDNPLDRPAEIEWAQVSVVEDAVLDADGDAILNSSGEPFDPGVTRDVTRPLLIIERNEATFDTAWADTYTNLVNTDAFFGFAPGQARILSITGRRIVENATFFWRVRYEVAFRREGWRAFIRDQGYRVVSSDGDPAGENAVGYREVEDAEGKSVSEPVDLDGSGNKRDPMDPPYYHEFKLYPEGAFAPLGLESV